MKQPKKLTRDHKIFLSKCNMNPENWMIQYEDKEKVIYVNKINGQTRERNYVNWR